MGTFPHSLWFPQGQGHTFQKGSSFTVTGINDRTPQEPHPCTLPLSLRSFLLRKKQHTQTQKNPQAHTWLGFGYPHNSNKISFYIKFHFRKLAGFRASLNPAQTRPAASPRLCSIEPELIEQVLATLT